ncbi:MAG TPA: hypothetical protein VF078_11440, partial [Nitrospira sp.]
MKVAVAQSLAGITQVLVGHQAVKILVGVSKRVEVFLALIGGIKETQNMLDFCAQHQIESDIELIPIQQVNEAYER